MRHAFKVNFPLSTNPTPKIPLNHDPTLKGASRALFFFFPLSLAGLGSRVGSLTPFLPKVRLILSNFLSSRYQNAIPTHQSVVSWSQNLGFAARHHRRPSPSDLVRIGCYRLVLASVD